MNIRITKHSIMIFVITGLSITPFRITRHSMTIKNSEAGLTETNCGPILRGHEAVPSQMFQRLN